MNSSSHCLVLTPSFSEVLCLTLHILRFQVQRFSQLPTRNNGTKISVRAERARPFSGCWPLSINNILVLFAWLSPKLVKKMEEWALAHLASGRPSEQERLHNGSFTGRMDEAYRPEGPREGEYSSAVHTCRAVATLKPCYLF